MGPSKIIGAVTQLRKGAPRFILGFFEIFFLVGLCSLLILKSRGTWQRGGRRMRSRQLKRVDRVDSGPPDHHQMHMHKGGPLIVLSDIRRS